MTGARPDTWMPVYIGDYLADTMHLSYAEHGAYLLLIFAYWRSGAPLPDDDRMLAGICKASAKQWRDLRPTLARFFQIEDGLWRHKRVDDELVRATAGYAKRSAAAMKRWGNASSKADAMHHALHKQPQPQPQPQSNPRGLENPPDPPDHAEAIRLWNELADECGLARCQVLSAERKRKLRSRLKECGGIEGWKAALAKIRGSPFLLGENDRSWRADIDFLLSLSKFTKLMEGAYDRSGKVQGPNAGGLTGFAAVAAELSAGSGDGWLEEAREPDGTGDRGGEVAGKVRRGAFAPG